MINVNIKFDKADGPNKAWNAARADSQARILHGEPFTIKGGQAEATGFLLLELATGGWCYATSIEIAGAIFGKDLFGVVP